MELTVRTVLILVAVVCFIIAAVGGAVPRVNLTALGLAFFAASFLAPQ